MLFDTKAFGIRVKQLRRSRGLTQEQLAEMLHISVSHLGKIEIGYNAPSIDLILTMAEFFEVSTDDLLWGDGFHDRPCGPSCAGGRLMCPLIRWYI